MSKISGNPSPTDRTIEVAAFKPLSRNDVASILGVSVRTVENWRREKRIPPSFDIGGRTYWHPEVFYSSLSAMLRGATPVEEGGAPTANKAVISTNKKPASTTALEKSRKRSAIAIASMTNS
jgi:hypothetical protein